MSNFILFPVASDARAPAVIVTTTPGYQYDVPEVTLAVRPQNTPRPAPTTPRPAPTTEEPLALYGPPARAGKAFSSPRRNNRFV